MIMISLITSTQRAVGVTIYDTSTRNDDLYGSYLSNDNIDIIAVAYPRCFFGGLSVL